MARPVLLVVLPVLALIAALLGECVLARQEAADDPLPGVVVETLGRSSLGGEDGDDLVLLRVTIEPGASIPASDGPRAALIVLEEGRVAVELDGGEANLTLAGGNGTVPLAPGDETTLAPGDVVSTSEGARLVLDNVGDGEATLLYAAVSAADAPLFTAASPHDASGTFSVETFACPVGMTVATLETDACEPAAESLVAWSLESDQFDAPLGSDEASVTGATTTWQGLPGGTYFVELTADHSPRVTATISSRAATRSRVRTSAPHASTTMHPGHARASTPTSSWATRPRPDENVSGQTRGSPAITQPQPRGCGTRVNWQGLQHSMVPLVRRDLLALRRRNGAEGDGRACNTPMASGGSHRGGLCSLGGRACWPG